MTPTLLPAYRPRLRLSRSSAHALNALARRTRTFSLSTGTGDAWRGCLTPLTNATLPAGPMLQIQLSWHAHTLALQLPRIAVQAWLESQVPDLQFTHLPDTLLSCVLELAFNQIATAQHHHRGMLRVLTYNTTPVSKNSPLPHTWALSLHDPSTGWHMQGLLHSDDNTLAALAEYFMEYPEQAGPADIRTLPLEVVVTVGRTRLPLQALKSVRQGDVVMLDHCLIEPDGQLWLTLNNALGVRIRHENGSYIVTQGWRRLMTESSPDQPVGDTAENATTPETGPAQANDQAMNIDSPDTDNTDTADAIEHGAIPLSRLNDVTISLSFDLGQRRLSLAELQVLQPGEIFALARPFDDGPVHIRANGALIGFGELVDVDGQLGVQVVRLGSAQ